MPIGQSMVYMSGSLCELQADVPRVGSDLSSCTAPRINGGMAMDSVVHPQRMASVQLLMATSLGNAELVLEV